MDKENIVQFRYQSNEFLKSESLRSDDFELQYVDKTNYSDYIPDFHKLLDWIYIHLKTWKNAPTYDEIIKRFQNNSCCVLFYYKVQGLDIRALDTYFLIVLLTISSLSVKK